MMYKFKTITTGMLITMVMLLLGGQGMEVQASQNEAQDRTLNTDVERRIYYTMFVYINDANKFAEYERQVQPIVAHHEMGIERVFSPESVWAKDTEKPDRIYVMYFNNDEAEKSFNNDPEFKKIVHLRNESIKMFGVKGHVVGGDFSPQNVSARAYSIELAYYGSRGAEGYEAMRKFANPVMQQYGHHFERTIKVTSAFGVDKPDIVNIMYYDSLSGSKLMKKDSHKKSIEARYAKAVSNSIWVFASTVSE